MNCIMYTLNEIKGQIPFEILNAAMNIDEQPSMVNITSLDDKILRKVLKQRVLLDANIVGGVELIIPLRNITPSYFEDFYTIYNVPPEATNNREIMSVLNLTFMPSNGYYGAVSNNVGMNGGYQTFNGNGSMGHNAIMGVVDKIGNAASSSGMLAHTHLELVGYNTVLVYAHYRAITNFGIRAVVENSSNLNNIQPRSYKNFSILSVLATKAHIYNKLIVAMNSGALQSGQDLGIFKSIVESYSDAEENYYIYLRDVWASVAYMNDVTRYNRYLGSMLPSNL